MNSLFRMGPYLRPYRWYLFFGFLTVVLPVALELVVPRMLQFIIDDGIREGSMAVVWRGSLVMLGAAVLIGSMTIAQGICRAQVSQGLAFDLRNDLFRKIELLTFADFDQFRTGELMTRLSSDASTIRNFFSNGLAVMIRMLLMVIGSVVMMVVTDAQLALMVVAALGLAALVIWALLLVTQPIFHQVQRRLGALYTVVHENLAGVQLVKAYVRERFENDRFEERNHDYLVENVRVGRLLALAIPVLALITNLTLVVILWRGGLDTVGGRLTVGELIAFVNYMLIGMAPVLGLSRMLTMVARANVSVQRVYEILEAEARFSVAEAPHVPADGRRGKIAFKDVTFRYERRPDAEEDAEPGANGSVGSGHEEVLRGVSFEVAPGQQLALMGATGAGKTTLTRLIPRFYDATAGSVQVDGVDVREWDLEALRTGIGMVMQQPTLFKGTVRENIAFGRSEASLEEVVAAARSAQAHDFVSAMPGGYDSVVESRGANLSGGQKQRIAIARALLVSPPILILDDSTSSVDFETEVRLQDALDELMEGRTTLIVAQRISSVVTADQILVLDEGRIAARGTHEELLELSPIYREIYDSQLGGAGAGS